jgi:5-methyltetrahydropteroyltriglutamate--homocysteine methyltransferase
VDELALEFAMPGAGSMEVLSQLPSRLRLGLGCVDVRCPGSEEVATIVQRVQQALQRVPAKRLTLNPDCGFAPSGNNPIPLDEAYAKLRALGQAASLLRSQASGERGASAPRTPDP